MSERYIRTFTAAENLEGKEGLAVYLTTSGAKICTGGTTKPVGVLVEGGKGVGTKCSVVLQGWAYLAVSAAISPGEWIKISSAGRGLAATSGSFVIGYSIKEDAAEANEECLIIVSPSPAKFVTT